MTFISTYGFKPTKIRSIIAPRGLGPKEVTIVIPVWNNQKGVDVFLESLEKLDKDRKYIREVIIIDSPPHYVEIRDDLSLEIPVRVFHSEKEGPAAARNIGWAHAKTAWILFTDSDCIPQENWIEGYTTSLNGSVGYAGNVRALGQDAISKYYETQKILIPAPYRDYGQEYPEFLVTANALVWKLALEKVKGFNEEIKTAAGEDVDLGFRLRTIGSLEYAMNSVIKHNFNDGIEGFKERFIRYGRGNRKISDLYDIDLTPKPFQPNVKSSINSELASLQYECLNQGYMMKN